MIPSLRLSALRITLVMTLGVCGAIFAMQLRGVSGIAAVGQPGGYPGAKTIVELTDTALMRRWQFDIRAQVKRGLFDFVENQAGGYRAARLTETSPNPNLATFYEAFCLTEAAEDSEWQAFIAAVQRWCKERPDSITPRIALANVYAGYAWKARTTKWANEVTPEGWVIMRERLELAQRVLSEAKALPEKCAGWYPVAQRVALGVGLPREEYDRLFNEGVEAFPYYVLIYCAKAHYLLPRWYGKPGEWEAFAAEMMHMPGLPNAKEIYAKIAIQMSPYLEQDFSRSLKSWTLMKESFRVLQAREPYALRIMSAFCYAASLVEDYRQTREQLLLLDGRVDRACWPDGEYLNKLAAWCSQDDAVLEEKVRKFQQEHP